MPGLTCLNSDHLQSETRMPCEFQPDYSTPDGRYRIGLAVPEHLACLPAIERAAASLFPDAVLSAPLREQVTTQEALARAHAAGRVWVAVSVSGEPVAFALAELEGAVAHLCEVDVHPHHQRQGLGACLIDAVVRWARDGQASTLTLTTFCTLAWNAPYYARLGFCQVPEDELSAALRQRLLAEHEAGLRERVAMVLSL